MAINAAPHIHAVTPQLQVSDVIQILPPHDWGGCFAIVDNVKTWGCIAYVEIPKSDEHPNRQIYIRLETKEFISLGVKAPLVVA